MCMESVALVSHCCGPPVLEIRPQVYPRLVGHWFILPGHQFLLGEHVRPVHLVFRLGDLHASRPFNAIIIWEVFLQFIGFDEIGFDVVVAIPGDIHILHLCFIVPRR